MDKLTRKQKGFVKDYVATGNGTQSALNNYDIESDKPEKVASVIATENLAKPSIRQAIAELLPDELLSEKHRRLFDQKQLAYFVFPKDMPDNEIVEHLYANGLDCIVVRPSDKGKMAFYSIDDANAIKSALDMAYKVKGTYAPEKTVNVNIEAESSEEVKQLAEQLNALHRTTSIGGDGVVSSPMGEEVQN